MSKQKFSTVALIGAPNAGKSTLINHFVGDKVAIVSPKVQTTRTLMRGIYTKDDLQLVFIDTPGIFAPRGTLERNIVKNAWGGIKEAEMAIVLVNGKKDLVKDSEHLLKRLADSQIPLIAAVNKVDVCARSKIDEIEQQLKDIGIFEKIFRISALRGIDTNQLLNYLAENAQEGNWMFAEDEITDAPMKFFAAEVTREKLFLRLQQELPYSCAVDTESYAENEDGSITIHQIIYVSRDNHKAIVIGKGATMIKSISQASREELAITLDRPVHLFLHVKVRENWVDYMDIEHLS